MQYIHYDISTGLPGNKVYNCHRDSSGYLWFPSENGLLKYNGYTFKVLNTENSGLPDNDVYWVEIDHRGRIWPRTLTNRFGYLSHDVFHDVYKERTNSNRIWVNHFVDLGPVIVFHVSNSGDRFKLFFADTAGHTFEACYDSKTYTLGFNNRGSIYNLDNIDSPKYLRAFDLLKSPPSERVITIKSPIHQIFSTTNTDVYQDKYAFLIDLTPTNGLIKRIDLHTGAVKTRSILEHVDASESVYSVSFNCYPFQLVTNRCLYRFDTALSIIDCKKIQIPFNSHEQISFRFTDYTGGDWYPSQAHGIWWIYTAPELLHRQTINVPVGSKLVQGNSSDAYFWNNDEQFLYRINKDLRTEKWHIPYAGLNSLVEEQDGSTTFFFQLATIKINLQTGETTDLFGQQRHILLNDKLDRNLNPDKWYSQKKLPNGNLACNYYIGFISGYTYAPGHYLAGGAGSVNQIKTGNDTIRISRISQGRYSGGVYSRFWNRQILYSPLQVAVFSPLTETIVPLSYVRPGSRISTVCFDDYGRAYVLLNDGLLQFDPFTMTWHELAQGFNTDGAKITIHNNHLLLAGTFGLAVATIDKSGRAGDFHFAVNVKNTLYREIKGMWIAGNHKAVLQTDQGWLSADIDSLLQNGLQRQKSNIGNCAIVLNEPEARKLSQDDTVYLDQVNNHLLFDAINLYGNGTPQFSYKIANGEWQHSISGEVIPAGLMPGKCYPVYIRVNDKSWRSAVQRFYVYTTPYWYQTSPWHTIFLVAGGILLLLSVLGIVSISRFWINKANAKKQMLTDLELRAIHSQINPHFIFNTLSTALYFINRKEYENAYGHVNKFSHLLRSYLKSSQDRYVLLSEEIEMLKRYIELQQARFEHLFSYNIYIDNKVPAGNIQIPSLLLQPLVENAINHGLFHRREPGGQLLLRFEHGADNNELVCTIEDNGVGREAAATLKRSHDADRESYGSKLTDKLMSVFRQYEAMDIRITYTDKQTPDTGTVVTLTIRNIRYTG